MGFGKNRCIRAALATKNAGIDQAMDWLMANMDDVTLDAPIESTKKSAAAEPQADASIVTALEQMGFGKNRCIRAALATKNAGTGQAMDWLMANMDDVTLDAPIESAKKKESGAAAVDESLVAQLLEITGMPQNRCRCALCVCMSCVCMRCVCMRCVCMRCV
jgi:uncharacterized UBP type Zn finger protein